jgi:nucleotide-binding universal stress UspA family protein
MKLVLVGDDGSEVAARAMDWAIRFAGERQAVATAVHASRTGTDPRPELRIECVNVPDPHPASGIIQTAEELDADLIVLGRRGGGGFPSLPIGTTAHVVAAAAGRPVVIVPDAGTDDHEPLIRRVVVGIDGLPSSTEAAAWAARACPAAAFFAVHAVEIAPALIGVDGDEASRLYDRAHDRAIDLMRESWCRPLQEAGVDFDVVVEEGAPAEVILNTAARVQADLVVVSRRDYHLLRGTLGSVSQRVLAYAPCPAAIVPPPA